MRPDVAAFRELDTLVRNLSEQLAAYRRRALSSEQRMRELEQQLTANAGALQELRSQTEGLRSARDEARADAERLGRELATTAGELGEVKAAYAVVAAKSTPEGFDQELARENEQLRTRLTDARDRTAQLGERVRFLRQQIGQGAER
ncbi:MAG TPA: hypothetical protein VGE27_09210 [Gemmatimonas sp.]|uniref:hypothetical protein n=1 Tax=Gemmatimonas sp. TaxID=1962908 RepID=UPI002EDA8524